MIRYVLAILLGIFIVLYGREAWANHQLRGELVVADSLADARAADAAAERARAEGWVVETGFASPGALDAYLDSLTAAGDSQVATLRDDLQASRVRIEQLTGLVATLRGEIQSQATETETDSTGTVTRYAGDFEDGPLEGVWTFHVEQELMELIWRAQIRAELLSSRTGDGRTMVFARSPDPRVELEVDRLFLDPQEPVVEQTGLSWYWIPVAALVGVGARDFLPW